MDEDIPLAAGNITSLVSQEEEIDLDEEIPKAPIKAKKDKAEGEEIDLDEYIPTGSADEVDLDEDPIPLGTLPQTGNTAPIVFYLSGILLLAFGAFLLLAESKKNRER